jgi:Na+-translocating ferredoxin:NAD+ oxidoreductase RnfA subunit
MLVVGTFNKDAEFSFTKAQQGIFATVMGIAIILIFLNALGWLELAYDFLKINWSGEAVSAIILELLMAAFIGFLGKPTKVVEKKKEDKVED